MRILIVGDSEADYLAKCHEAFRTGLRRTFDTRMFGKGYDCYDPTLTTFPQIVRHIFPDATPDLVLVPFDMLPAQNRFHYEEIKELTVPKAILLGDYWNITDRPDYTESFIEALKHFDISYV